MLNDPDAPTGAQRRENLEPTDDAGKAKAEEAKAARSAQQEALARNLQPLTGIDPAAFAAAVAIAVKQAMGDAPVAKGKSAKGDALV